MEAWRVGRPVVADGHRFVSIRNRIRILIKVKSRIRIRIEVKSRICFPHQNERGIGIRIKVMQILNTASQVKTFHCWGRAPTTTCGGLFNHSLQEETGADQ